ncbi:MAG: oligosaccharide flippase family protein [Anaerolineaceae bacterium]|nr:oligosaccharide flippase family protein [Anaerolineaceae bacterium]
MIRRRLPDILIAALLFTLPLALFWPQTVGGRTLLPTENLFQYEPFATYAEAAGAPAVPHNALLSDLVLENYQWKTFIRESIAQGEIPLWNPHQFAGIPFLAAGQQSTLYPLSIIYYVLPLTAAYGWFTVVQLWLAGLFMYLFLRGLNAGRFGGLVAGVTYQLSAFFVISAVFPMIIGAAAWLPLILLMAEFIIQQRSLFGRPSSIPWAAIGAGALGCNILAGHVEITYYTLLITAFYAGLRLALTRRSLVNLWRHIVQRGAWLAVMVALGLGIGAVQFIPLFELVSVNFRSDSATYEQVISWAHPPRDVVQFAMPNFYGSPAQHTYFDVFTGETAPVTVNAAGNAINNTDWGIKNYVEGALYLGILPLALALFAVVVAMVRGRGVPRPYGEGEEIAVNETVAAHGGAPLREYNPPYRLIFALLTLLGLTFMFGLPTYRLLYMLPGISQLHSPFRWIFAVTLGVAVLAGFGADVLTNADKSCRKWAGRFGYALVGGGVVVLGGLLLSRVFYVQVEPLIERIFTGMAKAPDAFSDARTFYSYQFTNVLTFGVMLVGAGVVFLWKNRTLTPDVSVGPHGGAPVPITPRFPLWQVFAVGLIAADLMIASWGFNPASDPALLDYTPPAIEWLLQQEGDWRYTTLDDPNPPHRPIMNANMGWRYGLDDIRGYESIIPKQYVDFMSQLAPQTQLEYNRIAPLYTDYDDGFDYVDALNSPLLGALNVRYVITHRSVTLPEELTTSIDPRRIPPSWRLAYEDDAVRIWEHGYLPRAVVVWEHGGGKPDITGNNWGIEFNVTIEHDTGREKVLHANLYADVESWLVVSESYFPGWRAYVRPRGGGDDTEKPLPVELVSGNFQGVNLSPAVLEETFAGIYDTLPDTQRRALDDRQVTVRMVYSPASFQVGLFGSVISGALAVFGVGVWLWRLLFGTAADAASGVSRVARNSVAPIILNLFNRGIDFAFAFIMLRILGPEGAGIYFYAGIVFIWFDIFTNFGLNLFLTREVARDRSHAGRYFFNTSALRLLLVLAGVPLLLGFLFLRQATVEPPLTQEALFAIGLLYIGLLPNSLSTGMTALFYAFEQAEYPAAVATVATINKAVLGLVALLMGFGVVGLAGVSIITNILTLAILIYGGRKLIGWGRATPPPTPLPATQGGGTTRLDRKLLRGMVGEGWPLMLNHFLATIFFQIDVVIIQGIHGDNMVGQYSVAYKWISALNIIPSFFTQAMLPIMSRQAHEDKDALRRNYILAIKLLVSVAVPVAIVFTALAYVLTGLLGGAEFLPDGAIATQLMIWSIPIGWMNSLTQYVLIALDLQRRITRAFVIAVTFNIVGNLIFIPQYGYQAAAIITIFSEAILLLPFALLLHGALGRLPWAGMLWREAVAGSVMVAVLVIGWPIQPFLALVVAGVAYAGALLGLRPFSADELGRLGPLLPGRLRRLIPVGR